MSESIEEFQKQIEDKCDKVRVALAECPEATPHEAKTHSAFALETSIYLYRLLRYINKEIIKVEVQKDASYSSAFKNIDDKVNVSKAKAIASANIDHQKHSIMLKKLENDREYFKGMVSVCENSHKFYKSQFLE